MKDNLDMLIEVLVDKSREHGDRLDAASYLEEYDDERAETALCAVCIDSLEDEDVLESCGESLGGIWSRKGRVDERVYVALVGSARLFVDAIMKQRAPDLLAKISGRNVGQ